MAEEAPPRCYVRDWLARSADKELFIDSAFRSYKGAFVLRRPVAYPVSLSLPGHVAGLGSLLVDLVASRQTDCAA